MSSTTQRRRMDRGILERLHDGRGVKSICKELKVGKDRVREVRRRGIAAGYLDSDTCGRGPGTVPIPPVPIAVFADVLDGRQCRTSDADQQLLLQLEWIKERMLGGWSPITVFEERPLECHGIGRSSFYRFLDRHGLYKITGIKAGATEGMIGPIVHEPAEALILDWGKLRDVVDPQTGEKRVLWAFVGVLGFSRYMMIRLVWTNDIPTTLDAIESMLQEIGGVPRRVTSDNPKCFAIKAHRHDPLLNPAFERFASHYGFRIECLPPQDPEKKGKVERLMPFARRLFEAYPKEFGGMASAQSYMNNKCCIANERYIVEATRLAGLVNGSF